MSYETVVVFSLKSGEDALAALIEKIRDLINKHGTVENFEDWGKKRLAYPIEKETEGHYVLFNFRSDAEFPAELDRICKITEGVMRSLIIRK